MANVTFHRTDKKQQIVKDYLVENGIVTAEDMDNYKGVKLGDDSTVIVTRAATEDESAEIKTAVPMVETVTICTVYGAFNGRVKAIDEYAYVTARIDL